MNDREKDIIREAVINQALTGNPLTKEEIAFMANLVDRGITGDEAAQLIIADILKKDTKEKNKECYKSDVKKKVSG